MTKNSMKVRINDSGKWRRIDSATVVYADCVLTRKNSRYEDEEVKGELHVKLTHEGVLIDFWADNDFENQKAGGAIATSCMLLDDLIGMLK